MLCDPAGYVVELVRLSDQAEGQIEHVGEASFYRLRSELFQCVSLESWASSKYARLAASSLEQAAFGRVMIVLQERGAALWSFSRRSKRHARDRSPLDRKTSEAHSRLCGSHDSWRRSCSVDSRCAWAGSSGMHCLGDEGLSQSAQPTEHLNLIQSAPLLIFEHAEGQRFALPISGISRLAQLPLSRTKRAGRQRVIQFDGDIFPVFGISDDLSDFPPLHGEAKYHRHGGRKCRLRCVPASRPLPCAGCGPHCGHCRGRRYGCGWERNSTAIPRRESSADKLQRFSTLEELWTRANPIMSQSALLPENGERDA